MDSLAIANEIKDQIGGRALYMIGAKNLTSTGRGPDELGGLCMKIMRNSKKVTHIKVSLDASDTYTVEFIKQGRAPSYKVERLAVHDSIYFDQLHALIERETGLALSL